MRKGVQISIPGHMPSGILAVRGDTETRALMAQVQAGFQDFKNHHVARVSALETDLATAKAAWHLNGNGSRGGVSLHPDDPEYSNTFAGYFRKGIDENVLREANASGHRAKINAAMSEGTPNSGGYLAPTEWDRRITQAQLAKSPMRRLATVQNTTVGAFTTLWNNAAWGSGWVGETASRPQTSNATLDPVTFAAGEIYAQPAITQRLLDDTDFNLEQWLANQVETEFNRQEGIAFISGDGVNKPFGLLQYVTGGAAAAQHPGGVLGGITAASATTISPDELITLAYNLGAAYRTNATWLMNSTTAALISKLKDGQGDYIWREGLLAGQPPSLLGRPVELDENMPSVATGNIPIAFGDFAAGYLINDRLGTRILRDPFTAKPYVLFYITKRVGAGVQDPTAIKLLKMA